MVVVLQGGEPGYEETAKMIVESALCLALSEVECPGVALGGGFHTPATALGNVLVGRLQDAGIKFTVEGPLSRTSRM